MPSNQKASNTTAPTQFLQAGDETYAYRRFGSGSGLPLLLLQHFTGTLDNWDPAVTDALASGREVILFESAGLGRSTGKVPDTVAGMAKHALAFLDGLRLNACDVLGFSLGGMVAQQMAQDCPSIFRRMILVGTAPRGGEDIMHLDKPSLARFLGDPKLQGYAVLQKLFFAPTDSVRRPAPPLSNGSPNAKKIESLSQDRRLPKLKWQPSRLGEVHRSALCGPEEHQASDPSGEWHSRRDDSRPELVLAECDPAKRSSHDLSQLRPRLFVSISQLLRAASGIIPSFQFKVCALLSWSAHFPQRHYIGGCCDRDTRLPVLTLPRHRISPRPEFKPARSPINKGTAILSLHRCPTFCR